MIFVIIYLLITACCTSCMLIVALSCGGIRTLCACSGIVHVQAGIVGFISTDCSPCCCCRYYCNQCRATHHVYNSDEIITIINNALLTWWINHLSRSHTSHKNKFLCWSHTVPGPTCLEILLQLSTCHREGQFRNILPVEKWHLSRQFRCCVTLFFQCCNVSICHFFPFYCMSAVSIHLFLPLYCNVSLSQHSYSI